MNRLLTTKETAELLGVSPGTLRVWRSTGSGDIPYVKINRSVRYPEEHLKEYINSHMHNSASC